MTAPDLFQEMFAKGVHLSMNGDRVLVRAPVPLSDELQEELRARRDEIAAAIDSELGAYLATLAEFEPESEHDHPPVPPFPERPERPIAWAAWWGTIERCREINNTNNSRRSP